MSAARVGLFKRGWHEIPEVIGSSFMALVGIGLMTSGIYIYYKKDGDNRPYKLEYTVYRDDDPRVAKVHKEYKI